jgi:proline dehydrogenase
MLRSAILYLSNQRQVFDFVRNNRIAKQAARRFVAGETLEEALDAVKALNAKGLTATLDQLGESVTNEQEARRTRDAYLQILDRIQERRLDCNVSVKLTSMGLDISEELCVSQMHDVLSRAQAYGSFVRVDMESSDYTERTLKLVEERLWGPYKGHVGIVLQSYLYRTMADAQRANELGMRVRLCKGAYKEPASVAWPEKRDVDQNFVKVMHELMSKGTYPGIATHDETIIAEARRYAQEQGIAPDRYEFQMLYGVRRDLQDMLVKDGYRMRVYVPFGTQWYPYLMRRMAERPANMMLIPMNVMKEMVGRRR